MQTDYAAVMNPMIELHGGEVARARRLELEGEYDTALSALVSGLLARCKTGSAAVRFVEKDFDDIAASSDDTMSSIYDRVRYDIINRIGDVTGPSPRQQAMLNRLAGIGGVVVVVLLAITYAGVRQYSATPVTAAIDTKMGIRQRTDALAKVLRYNSFGVGGGMARQALFWPIQPTDKEARDAGEFAYLIMAGAQRLEETHSACNVPASTGATLSDDEIVLFERVTTYLRKDATQWRQPPAMTILDPIRSLYPC